MFFLDISCRKFTKLHLWFITDPSVPVTPQISRTNATTIEMEIHQASNLNDQIMYVVMFTLVSIKSNFTPFFLCSF